MVRNSLTAGRIFAKNSWPEHPEVSPIIKSSQSSTGSMTSLLPCITAELSQEKNKEHHAKKKLGQ